MRVRPLTAAIILVATLAVGGIAGCASSASSGGQAGPTTPAATAQAAGVEPYHGIYYERLKDGYLLTCEYAGDGGGGGPSCDWPGHQAWLEKQQK